MHFANFTAIVIAEQQDCGSIAGLQGALNFYERAWP